MNTSHFTSFDGASIFYRSWRAERGKRALVVLHRGHEHSGRLDEFAQDERLAGYQIFAYDQRGLGHTEASVSPCYMDYVRDLDAFVQHLKREHGVGAEEIFLVANSIAGTIVAGYLQLFAPPIAGCALLAPAFGIRLYVPLAEASLAVATRFMPKMEVPSYVKSRVLTHDPAQQAAYDADPLITRSINGALLVDMLRQGRRLVEDAAAMRTPTLLISAGRDFVVKNHLQREFFARLGTPMEQKEFRVIPQAFHGLLFESMRGEIVGHMANFAQRCFKQASTAPLSATVPAELHTVEEYERLRLGLAPWGQRVGFACQRVAMRCLGWMSRGMALGVKHGFDSGLSLDYVYKNEARGFVPFLGKWLDRSYLNAIGWRGIRRRKEHLLQMLEGEIARLRAVEHTGVIRILDIAGGPGNYLFDLKSKHEGLDITVNDFMPANVEQGRRGVEERGWGETMRFTQLDCFDEASYRQMRGGEAAHIVIISGIFELFPENACVQRAIRGAASVLAEGGVICYTGQPWHPQLAQIALVLNSHQGRDWVMRRRTQRELDRLFLSAVPALCKEAQLIDDFGIFTVGLMRKC